MDAWLLHHTTAQRGTACGHAVHPSRAAAPPQAAGAAAGWPSGSPACRRRLLLSACGCRLTVQDGLALLEESDGVAIRHARLHTDRQ